MGNAGGGKEIFRKNIKKHCERGKYMI